MFLRLNKSDEKEIFINMDYVYHFLPEGSYMTRLFFVKGQSLSYVDVKHTPEEILGMLKK